MAEQEMWCKASHTGNGRSQHKWVMEQKAGEQSGRLDLNGRRLGQGMGDTKEECSKAG